MKQRKEPIVNIVFILGKCKMTATLSRREGTALSLQNNVKYLSITTVSFITLKHVIKEFSQCSIFLQSIIMANYWFLSLSILLFLGFSKSCTSGNISDAYLKSCLLGIEDCEPLQNCKCLTGKLGRKEILRTLWTKSSSGHMWLFYFSEEEFHTAHLSFGRV